MKKLVKWKADKVVNIIKIHTKYQITKDNANDLPFNKVKIVKLIVRIIYTTRTVLLTIVKQKS